MTTRGMLIRLLVIGGVLLSTGIANVLMTAAGHPLLPQPVFFSVHAALLIYLCLCLVRYIAREDRRSESQWRV